MAGLFALLFCTGAVLLYLLRPLRNLRLLTDFVRHLDSKNGEQLTLTRTTAEFETLKTALNTASSSLATMLQTAVAEAAKLSASEAQSRSILRTMHDGVMHFDPQGFILNVNNQIEEIFGYGEDELIGHNINLLMPEPHRSAHDGYLAGYPRNIVGRRVELEGLRKDCLLYTSRCL